MAKERRKGAYHGPPASRALHLLGLQQNAQRKCDGARQRHAALYVFSPKGQNRRGVHGKQTRNTKKLQQKGPKNTTGRRLLTVQHTIHRIEALVSLTGRACCLDGMRRISKSSSCGWASLPKPITGQRLDKNPPVKLIVLFFFFGLRFGGCFEGQLQGNAQLRGSPRVLV